MNDTTLGLGLVLLGVLSALFSSSETALFSLEKTDRSRFKQDNPLTGKKVLDLLDDPSSLLGTILFTNLVINVFFFSFFSRLSFVKVWNDSDSPLMNFMGVLLPIAVILVVGEVIPKVLALRYSYRWSLIVVYPISWFSRIMSPVVNLFTKLMPKQEQSGKMEVSELEEFVNVSVREGMIQESESSHLKDLIRFGVLTVEQVMIPRSDMVSFCLKDGPEKLLSLFKESGLTKIPVYRESPNDITEVIYLKQFLKRNDDQLDKLVTSIAICPEQLLVKNLYNRMQLTRQKTCVVVDEYGGTVGIVTFKDLLEEIVGDFNEDLSDGEEDAIQLENGSWQVSANMPLREFEEFFDVDLPQGDYLTVGAYALQLFNKTPYINEKVEDEFFVFNVAKIERQNIEELHVIKKEKLVYKAR